MKDELNEAVYASLLVGEIWQAAFSLLQARQLTQQLFDANLIVQQIEGIYKHVLADKVKKKR